jgi:hypothetical protein
MLCGLPSLSRIILTRSRFTISPSPPKLDASVSFGAATIAAQWSAHESIA